jgi:ribonuclease VapC
MLPVGQKVAYDTSALVAVFQERHETGMDYGFYLARRTCLIGWPTLFEFMIVMTGKTGRNDQYEFIEWLVSEPNIEAVDFTQEHAKQASLAMLRYGKGRGHPAQLNYGDCMSYAIAKVAMVPLIFKGNDFVHTDVNRDFE